ncbi:nucleotidyltransferase domain-containing protein [Chamaesiphon sp. OTE_8_metabat_110]|uniref:nucleotidyltransferase domain-containing protein n=1 Tax=Chamaesiphon sp. OTE_8_metabat_110 TaxID=2964696 RepID=UPI00286A8262|nr:nucleotidyltransferase domain-containing protein [Chamaesiphon sp. OTE_8_metabat_110]
METIAAQNADVVSSIGAQLQQLASQEQITILYACESGSRAWGFPSPDSDYDVRFIYLRPLEWYLSIEDRPDTIDLPIDSLLDINGWDLRKALKLFKGSNSAIYEWIQSPIVYRADGNLPHKLLELAQQYYAPRAGIHHYLNMATNCYRESLQTDTVKLKKYFYALRPILAAKSIVTYQTFPPMVFNDLLSLISDRPDILAEIDRLLTIKSTANEATTIAPIPLFNDFIRTEIEHCEAAVKLIPKHETDGAAIDRLFRKLVLTQA